MFINNFACCFFSCLLYFTMKESQSDFFSARPYDKFFYAKPAATFD